MRRERPLRVLFVAGSGRSGSTLVARLLGELDGFCNVGEACRYLFNLDMQARKLPCSCGMPPDQCAFWADLLAGIPHEVQHFMTSRVRVRNMHWLAHPHRGNQDLRLLETASDALRSALLSIEEREEGAVIVDASKNPSTGMFLSSLEGVELYVVHLVRDPRAVVASWSTPKSYLRPHPALQVTSWWLAHNLGSEFLRSRADHYYRLRFEDFLTDPRDQLATIAAAPSHQTPNTDIFTGHGVNLRSTQHALAGNPEKLVTGTLRIRPRPWNLSRGKRIFVSALCFPLMARYGYFKR